MNFNDMLKHKLTNGLIGTVTWNPDEESYHLQQKGINLGLSAEDGNFWSMFENKKIQITIKEV